MLFKSLIFSFFLFLSLQSQGMVLVPAYNENYCPNIDGVATVIRQSQDDRHLFESHRLMRIVEEWNQAFLRAGDSIVANNTNALCVGLMDDGGQPNAGAVGRQFLLMGVSLIAMLEEQNGVESEGKKLKEAFVLAHEYAHILQNLHDLKFDYTLPMLSTKIKEQHADCMAASMMEINNQIPNGSAEDLGKFIQQLADAHIVGDHGTAEQRLAAFQNGRIIGQIQRFIVGVTSTAVSSSQLVNECGVIYRPTN